MTNSVNPTFAPGNAWEVRMTWGDRNLEAEVIDGRRRKQLSLGEQPEDDFVIAQGTRLLLQWTPAGLKVQFSSGVTGTAALRGNAPVPLGQLVERGDIQENADGFHLVLSPGESLSLQVGGPRIDVRAARGRITRLAADPMAMVALVLSIALILMWIAATILPMQPLNLIPK